MVEQFDFREFARRGGSRKLSPSEFDTKRFLEEGGTKVYSRSGGDISPIDAATQRKIQARIQAQEQARQQEAEKQRQAALRIQKLEQAKQKQAEARKQQILAKVKLAEMEGRTPELTRTDFFELKRQGVQAGVVGRGSFSRAGQVGQFAGQELGKQSPKVTSIDVSNLGRTEFAKGTKIDTGLKDVKIFTAPTIYERTTGFFRDPTTGKKITTAETIYFDPRIGTSLTSTERPATKEERKLLKEGTSILEAPDKTPTKLQRKGSELIYGGYSGINTALYQGITKPSTEFVEKKTGKTVPELVSASVDFGVGYVSPVKVSDKIKDPIKGFYTGIAEDVIYSPAKQVALAGAGYGIGYASQGIISGAYAIPKIGAYTGLGTKTAIYGTGAVVTAGYVGGTAGQIYSAPTSYEKGRIAGVGTKDLLLFGYGTSKGVKGFQKTQGYFQTLGREEIKIRQGEYPSAPPRTQLKLFKENIYPELSDKPIAFHTTGQKFFGKGKPITPDLGASELGGLYGSTQISTPFTRISGSGGQTPKLSQALADFLSPPGKPGVAGLIPEGFRTVEWGGIAKKPVVIDGVRVKEFAYFKKPAKPGYADVPGMKGEIEAIFRPEAGSYGFESGTKFVVIKGVRVPLDVFKYDKSLVGEPTATTTGGTNLYGGSGSYTSPKPAYSPTASYSGSYTPNIKIASPSYSPPKSSYSTVSSSIPSSSIKLSSGLSSKGYSSSAKSSLAKSSSVSSSVLKSSLKSLASSKRSPSYSYAGSSGGGTTTTTTSYPYSSTGRRIVGFPSSFRPKKITTGKPFTVSVRRRGKFKPVGTYTSLGKAFEIGKTKVGRSLAATFKIGGVKLPGTPKGFRRKVTPTGTLFIEKRGLRLSTRPEVKEITIAKKRKRRKK